MTSLELSPSRDSFFPNLAGRLVSFDSIMREPLPPIEWLVESLIPAETRTVVFGEFASMKSWVLLDLCIHIAAGRPWLDTFTVTRPQSVLFIDEEMSARELRRRVKRLGEGMGLHELPIPFQAISHLGMRFQDGKVEALLDALSQVNFDPDIIVVETLRRVLDGNENEAADVGQFWQSVAPILTAGKTLIISHHMKKANGQGGDSMRNRASGSTDILAGTDTAYAITRKNNDLTISCVKNRIACEHEPFRVVMDNDGTEDGPVVMRYVGEGSSLAEEQTKLERGMELIQAFLTEQPGFTATREGILTYLHGQGMTQRTGERALLQLGKTGLVERIDHGLYRLKRELKAI